MTLSAKRWLPELAQLLSDVAHKPWSAEASVLAEAGVRLGKTYPLPMVDHQQARSRALAVYAAL